MTRSSTPDTPTETPPILEDEVAEGWAALSDGAHDDALLRAGRALAVAPTAQEAVELADAVVIACGDALGAAVGTTPPFGLVALRARAHAQRKEWRAATLLALEVAAFRPTLGFACWTPPWGRRIAWSRGTADEVLAAITAAAAALSPSPTGGERQNAEALHELLTLLPPTTRTSETGQYVRQLLLRRLGRREEAVRESARFWQAHRSWLSATALGNALRDAGALDEACAMFRAATELDPEDATAWVDLGDILASMGHLTEARSAYQAALERDPGDAGAQASLARLGQH